MNAAAGVLEHATVVEIDRRGVLIRGAPGSGKTSLAIELLHRCRTAGIASALIADDYVYVSRPEGSERLVATVPDTIAGMIEFRGFGVVSVGDERHKPDTELALAVHLVAPEHADRVADPDRSAGFHGVALPELALPSHWPRGCANAVLGWLGLSERIL